MSARTILNFDLCSSLGSPRNRSLDFFWNFIHQSILLSPAQLIYLDNGPCGDIH